MRAESRRCVWFDIDLRSDYDIEHRRYPQEPIIGAFLDWQRRHDLYPLRTASVGPGVWHGAFWPEDAALVRQWFAANSVEIAEVEQ